MIDPELREEKPVISPRLLRQFAGLWLAVFGSTAIWNAYVRAEPRAAIVPALLAVAVGIPGLVKPSSIRLFFVAALAVTMPIGRIVSFVLLAVLYYGVFTPIALIFRLMGRDVLSRREPDSDSHWVERTQPTDLRRYYHQV